MKEVLKNKKVIVKLFCFLVMIFLFILLGKKDYHTKISDNIRFSNEYKDISKNNLYQYINDSKVLEILNGNSGVILACFSENIWCHYYADYLNAVATEEQLDKLYYYDFQRDRTLNNTTYSNIVQKLSSYIRYDDNGKGQLFAPTILIVKDGMVIYFDDEVRDIKGKINPEEYFTDYKINLIKNNFRKAISLYLQKNEDNL